MSKALVVASLFLYSSVPAFKSTREKQNFSGTTLLSAFPVKQLPY